MDWIGVKIPYDQLLRRNAMFIRFLEYGFREIEEFLKSKTVKPCEEDCTLYSVGYKDGVNDAMIAIKNRFEIFK